jgi:hypothetical protein
MTLVSCHNEDNLDNLTTDNNNINTQNTTVVNEESINEILGSFSSPVEMAALMSSINVVFSKKYLINPALTENYDTNNKKALALGILSADLGYLNVYERSSLIVEYLSAIKRLSDDLRVSQFFDFNSFKRIATSNDNIDSLLFLSVQSFQDMDSYLRESARSNLSLLVITGVWLEGLYLLTQVANETKAEKLVNRIGEQKILFNMLFPIIKLYKDDEYFKELSEDFKEFQRVFDEVEITYIVTEPETKIINGVPVIIQNEESVIKINEDQLNQIIITTEKIRNKLINL